MNCKQHTPGLFRKKPVVIQAMLMPEHANADTAEQFFAIKNWIGDSVIQWSFGYETYIFVGMLEGSHRASLGDWIIQNVKGEFYPCKPDIFEATYDSADANNIGVAAGEQL
jgi:hypothetical protein